MRSHPTVSTPSFGCARPSPLSSHCSRQRSAHHSHLLYKRASETGSCQSSQKLCRCSTLCLCQRFNLYINCLAFTDLAVGLLLPLSTFREMITIHSNAVCDLLNGTIMFSINASIYIFVGLNLDRLHAIIRPLKYKSETKRWTTNVSLLLAFLVALTCSVPFWWVHHKMPKDGCFCQYPGFADVSTPLFL